MDVPDDCQLFSKVMTSDIPWAVRPVREGSFAICSHFSTHDHRSSIICTCDGNAQAGHFRRRELDRRPDFGDSVGVVLGVRDGRWELVGYSEKGDYQQLIPEHDAQNGEKWEKSAGGAETYPWTSRVRSNAGMQ
jgi:hypothetical protein